MRALRRYIGAKQNTLGYAGLLPKNLTPEKSQHRRTCPAFGRVPVWGAYIFAAHKKSVRGIVANMKGEKIMVNKKALFRTAGVLLAFMVVLGGCAQNAEEDDASSQNSGTGGDIQPVTLLELDGWLAAPVVGDTPDAAPIDTAQYSGTVAWSAEGGASVAVFEAGIVYTAALTLAAKDGYGFTGAGRFTHAGAAAITQKAAVGGVTVTVRFPAILTEAAQIAAYLAAAAESPAVLKLQMELSTANWQAILAAVNTSKTVLLDLSACTGADSPEAGGLSAEGVFDPYWQDTDTGRIAGKKMIRELILPGAALSIAAGAVGSPGTGANPSFKNFTGLKTIRGVFVTTVGDYAFFGCDGLTSVSLPKITSIGESAFQYCHGLTSVSLPQATTIGCYAFDDCRVLTSVSLPQATSIDTNAFQYCAKLASVTLGATLPTLGTNMFYGIATAQTVTVNVPAAKLNDYSADYGIGGSDTNCWGNAFRGKGWNGANYDTGTVNTNISLNFVGYN
jgi:hypothetical protein